MSEISISLLTQQNLPAFAAIVRAMEVEAYLSDGDAEQRAAAGLAASLARFDFTQSDSCWTLLATLAHSPAGYASCIRIPKADARVGFLFVDELYVLQPFRRAGVARALLQQVDSLALAQGLAGVRLLVRPANAIARNLYRATGFSEHPDTFCEKLL